MNRKIIIAACLLLSIVATSIYTFNDVSANTGFQLTPANTDITLKPGIAHTGSFQITNHEDATVSIDLSEGSLVDGQIIKQDFIWITLDETIFTLPKATSKEVKFTITAPDSTAKGVYNKLILININSQPQDLQPISFPNVNLSIPYQLNVFVDSVFTSDLGININEFSTQNKLVFDNLVTFKVKISNKDSNQVSKPIGYLNIISSMGEIVYTSVINENLDYIKNSEYKEYNITVNMPLVNLFDFGQYRAELLFTDSLSGLSEIKKTTFVSVHYLLFIILISGVIISIFLIRTFKSIIKEANFIDSQKKRNIIGLHKETRPKGKK